MRPSKSAGRGFSGAASIICVLGLLFFWGALQAHPAEPNATLGPYNARFLAGGVGLRQALPAASPLLGANAPWSMSGWVWVDHWPASAAIIAALGEGTASQCLCVLLAQGQIELRVSPGLALQGATSVELHAWHAFAGTYDGRKVRLYLDGIEVSSSTVNTAAITAVLRLAPEDINDPTGSHHFGGSLAQFSLMSRELSATEVADLNRRRPEFSLIYFDQVGSGWPWQEHAWRGLLEPQAAWTLPHGTAPFSPAQARPMQLQPALQESAPDRWWISNWRLAAAPGITASPQAISSVGLEVDHWYPAVVPGTVLTTLIANGSTRIRTTA